MYKEVLLPGGKWDAQFDEGLDTEGDKCVPEISGNLRLEVKQPPHHQKHHNVKCVANVAKPERVCVCVSGDGMGRGRRLQYKTTTTS